MENNENQDTSRPGAQEELADDVALLYSWANMEDATYRNFSRQPKSSSKQGAQGGKDEGLGEQSESNGSHGSNGSYVMVTDPANVEASDPAQVAGLAPEAEMLGTAMLGIQPPPPVRPGKASTALAVYSIAGGVGKTTICANLGKILCSLGEQLLLVDATDRGLLPFYFGATEPKTGPRKFKAPGANARFIQVIAAERVTTQWLESDVKNAMSTSQRTIFDLGPACESLLPTILGMCTAVLVPLLPDLNSVLTVSRIERSLNAHSTGSKTPAVFYFFNRFDEHNINDRQAMDFVARQCGRRLLPLVLRHSVEMAEALRAGISGTDLAPGSELSHDYLELAMWVRRLAPLSSAVLLPGRWSEQ